MQKLTLSILRHDQSSDLLTFEQSVVLVGREGGDIVTGDPQMSNRHAQFTFREGVLMFEDLQSTNGSYRVSGERITTALLVSPGTALKLGGCTLIVQEVQTGYERGGTAVVPQVNAAAVPSAALTPASPTAPTERPPAPFPLQTSKAPSPAPGAGVVDQFKTYLSQAADIYKTHYLGGVMTLGLVMVPAALISSLVGFVPVVGSVVALLVALAQLALAPISAGAMGRWALSTASGRSMTWQQAWKAALKNPVSEWLNVAVSMFISTVGTLLLVVPGIILGMFALPAYLLEGKSMIAINLRSADLVMKDPAHHIGLAFLAILLALPVMIAAAIVGALLGFVPLLGPPLASVISVAFSMAVVPFIYLLWSLIYFDARRQIEGEDASQLHQATLDSWGH